MSRPSPTPVALVTGCSSGIGLATALTLAGAGFRTVATLRAPERASALREAAEAAGLDEARLRIETLDVADADSVARCFDAVQEDWGPVDTLVNNAGIGGAGPLEVVPEDEHRLIFETNYWGAVRTTQAVLPGMRERQRGTIVNVSSGAGQMAVPNQAPYCASKWALEGMSESLAYEVRPFGVRVILVEPGIVATQIFENSAATTHFDKRSPYVSLMRRSGWLYRAGLRAPGTPEAVGAVILDAVQAVDPPLRHVVGDDAERLIAGHARTPTESFLEMAEIEDDEAYRERFRAIYDIDLS